MKKSAATVPFAEQKGFAEEIDRRVAERTAEVTAVNEQLRKKLTEYQRAEGVAREGELNFGLIVNSIPVPVAVTSPTGEVEALNQATLDYFGKTVEELKGWKSSDVVHPDDLERTVAAQVGAHQAGSAYNVESRHRRADGTYRWFNVLGLPLRDARGQILHWFHLQIDIDDRKRAEAIVRANERNLTEIINTIPALAWSAAPDGSADFFNQHYLDYLGLTAEEANGAGWAVAVHPDDLNGLMAAWQRIKASEKPGETEGRLRRDDGTYRWFLFRANPLRNEEGNIVKWYGANTDIEDSKQADAERKQNEETLRAIVETNPECVKVIDRDGTLLRVNAAGLAMSGAPSEEMILGQCFYDFLAPEDRDRYREFNEGVCSGHKGFLEFDIVNMQGARHHMETHAAPMPNTDGSFVQLGVTRDITERKLTLKKLQEKQAELKRANEYLTVAQELSKTGSYARDVPTDEQTLSDEMYRIMEFDPAKKVTHEMVLARIHPEDRLMFKEAQRVAMEAGADFKIDFRIVTDSGVVKHLRSVSRRVAEITDRLVYIGATQDVTEKKLAEEALDQARSELAHVARITTLGALTASIAHEVNQPLSGIITNASTCQRMLNADPPNLEGARETTRRALRDGNRAAEVITRLRALFSKKDAGTDSVDLNQAISEVVALSWSELQRSQIILQTELADHLPHVRGDRVQLQQVVLNLVRNASDSMSAINDRPRKLVIRTAREASDRVTLSVIDHGVGFSSEGAQRLFQAFYTTKNEGMGIGLSISRSIVESHQGQLWAKANDGPGATFSFSLPCPPRIDADRQQYPGITETGTDRDTDTKV